MRDSSKQSTNLLKIGQAAKLLGVSIDTLRRWEKSGKITAIRSLGGTRLYSLESLQKINPSFPSISYPLPATSSISTGELLKRASEQSSPNITLSGNEGYESYSSPSAQNDKGWDQNDKTGSFKKFLITKFLIATAGLAVITLALTTWISASYITHPKEAAQFFQNNIASGIFSPFEKLSHEVVAVISPTKAKELGFIPPDEPPPLALSQNSNINSNVLAVTSASRFLEVNADTQINGSLFVRDQINNVTLEGTPSASTINLTSGNTSLTVSKSTNLDQDVSTTSSPSFAALTLSSANAQIINGVLKFTLPSSSTTLIGTDTTNTLTNKSISGSTNTLTNIPNSALTNSKITISAGTNLTGGGDANLGDSVTLSLKSSPTISGTLTVSGATILSSTLDVTGAATFASTINSNTFTSTALTFAGNSPVISSANNQLSLAGSVGIGWTGSPTPTFPSLGLSVFGNVGIGTTSPQYQLQVIGSANFTGSISVGSCTGCSGAISTISASDGTATNPSISFINSTSTGLWSPSLNALSLTTNGSATNGLTITSSGLVGIGITSPGSSLQVIGNSVIGFSNSSAGPTNGLAVFGNIGIGTSTTSHNLEVVGTSNISGNATFGSQLLLANGSAPAPSYSFTNDSDTGLWSIGANLVGLTTNGSGSLQSGNTINGLSVNSNGNVGIGTTSPVYPLDISGNIGINGNNGLSINLSLNNLGIGQSAGGAITTGTTNTFVGIQSGLADSTGSGNTFVGYLSGQSTNASNNTFVGTRAGKYNTTGFQNNFFGYNAGLNNTTGTANNFFGTIAGVGNKTGSNNSFFGDSAGDVNINGSDNAFFGYGAGYTTITSRNSFFGSGAGTNNDVGSFNSFFGYNAGLSNNSGTDNSFFGLNSGQTITTGSYNTFFGTGADSTLATVNGSIGIGFSAQVTASNQLVIGGKDTVAQITQGYFGNGVTNTSPASFTLNATGGSGNNIAGANFTIAAGQSTGSANGGLLYFSTSPSGSAGSTLNNLITRMTIDQNGNVGIGITNPGSSLQVIGNSVIGFSNSSAGPTNGLAVFGNIGIGTSTTSHNLEVVGTSNISGNATFGSQLLLANGSAPAPSYSFTNDSDTGLWSIGANLVGLTTNGSGSLQSGNTINGLSVNSNGNVGIGTTTANYNLSVIGTANFTGNVGVGSTFTTSGLTLANGGLQSTTINASSKITTPAFQLTTGGSSNAVLISDSSGNGSWSSSVGGSLITNNSLDFAQFKDSMTLDASTSIATAGFNLTTSGTGALSFNNTGGFTVANAATFSSTINTNTFTSTALTFTGSSNVNIGASVPNTNLNLLPGTNGLINFAGGSASNGCTLDSTNGTFTCFGSIGLGSSAGNSGYWGRTGTTLSPVYSGDNVSTSGNISATGAGAVTSGGTLTAQNGLTLTTGALSLTSTTGTAALSLNLTTNAFNVNGNVFNIDTFNGRVGIGTSSPSFAAREFIKGSSNSTGITLQTIGSTGGFGLTVLDNGNVGIGTTGPVSALHVAGTTALSWGVGAVSLTQGLVTIGTSGTGGSSLMVNTPSLNTSYGSGLGIDGSYTNPGGIGTSVVNLKALGVYSGGGYDSAMAFYTSLGTTATEKMRINSAGNVGIGFTTPAAKLEVSGGNILLGNNNYLQFRNSAGSPLSVFTLTNDTNNITRFVAGVDAGGFQWTNQAQSTAWLTLTGSALTPGVQVQNANGTASAPSYSFTNSTSTGLWSPSANALSLTTNGSGTSGITITAGGNVGIGVTNPSSTLQVIGGNGQIRTGFTTTQMAVLGADGSNSAYVGSFTNHPFIFLVNNAEKIRLDTNGSLNIGYAGNAASGVLSVNGNVGIGTTNPLAPLDVIRDFADTNTIRDVAILQRSNSGGAAAAGLGAALRFRTETTTDGTLESTGRISSILTTPTAGAIVADLAFETVTDSSSTEKMRITGAGNVGIGFTSPINKFETWGAVSAMATTWPGNSGNGVFMAKNIANNVGQIWSANGSTQQQLNILGSPLVFSGHTNGSEDMRLDANGNVGVGVVGPVQKLEVNGSIRLSAGSGGGLVFADGTTLSTFPSAGSSQWTTSGSNIYNNNAGNVGIGTISPLVNLDVVGTGANVTGTYNYNGKITQDNTTKRGLYFGYDTSGQIGTLAAASAGAGSNLAFWTYSGSSWGERVKIDSNGNVGIGTTTPQNILDIVGATGSYDRFNSSFGHLLMHNSAAGSIYWSLATRGSGNFEIAESSTDPGTSYIAGGTLLTILSGGNTGIGTVSPVAKLHLVGTGTTTAPTFMTQNSTQTNFGLSVLDNGNVGIGTTTPTLALSLVGATGLPATSGTAQTGAFRIHASDNGVMDMGITVGGAGSWIQSTDKSNLSLYYPLLLNPRGGNVGIGTIGPNYKLDVSGGDINITGTYRVNGTPISSTSNWTASGNNIYYTTGNVGVGTSVPTALFEVGSPTNTNDVSHFYISGSSTTISTNPGVLAIINSNSTTNNWARLDFNDTVANNTNSSGSIAFQFTDRTSHYGDIAFATRNATSYAERMRIDKNGNLGIGFTSPNQALQVASDININPTNASLFGAAGTQLGISGSTANTLQKKLVLGIDTTDNYGIIQAGTLGTNYNLSLNPAGGNVGIGFSSPTVRLQVGAGGTGATNEAIIIDSGSGASTIGSYIGFGRNGVLKSVLGLAGSTNGIANGAVSNDLVFQDNGSILFSTNGGSTTSMQITTGGNVGIGTSVPAAPLHIYNNSAHVLAGSIAASYGAIGFQSTLTATNYAMTSNGNQTVINTPVGTALSFRANNNGGTIVGSSNTMTILSTGYVGIGYDNPATAFAVNGNVGIGTSIATGGKLVVDANVGSGTGVPLRLRNLGNSDSSTSNQIQMMFDFNNSSNVTNNYASILAKSAVVTAGSEQGNLYLRTLVAGVDDNRLSIVGGNVGIGTASPTARLHFVKASGESIKFESVNDTAEWITMDRTNGIDANRYMMTFKVSGGEQGSIKVVNGGGTQFNTTSDIRLKTDIRPYENGLDAVMKIQPRLFKWIAKPDDDHIGFIAQELNDVLPEFVDKSDTSPWSVDYGRITPVLVAGIQDLAHLQASASAQIASATNITSQFTLDSQGNLNTPKIKLDKLLLTDNVGIGTSNPDSLLSYDFAQTDSSSNLNNGTGLGTNSSVDVLASLKNIDTALLDVKNKQATDSAAIAGIQSDIASQSASLAETKSTTLSLAQQLASAAADLASTKSKVDSLNLTPPDTLYATDSASLTAGRLLVQSEATVSGMLASYDLKVSNSLTSLGTTSLASTTIAGDFTVDGSLSITGNSINAIGTDKINGTFGTLYLQDSALASALDIFNGKVAIDSSGNITTVGTLTATEVKTNKLTISNNPIATGSATLGATIGTATIPAGQTSVTILTTEASSSAKVFVTPTSVTDKVLSVGNIKNKQSFDVSILNPSLVDIIFNWWVVNTE